MYNEGISLAGDSVDTGIQYGIVTKSGNTISFGETKLGVGREQAKQFLRENPKVIEEIRKAVWEKVKEQRALEK